MELLYYFESIRTDFLDFLFEFWTQFGEETICIAVFALIFWCGNKTLGYKIAGTFFLSGTIAQTMKLTFRIPRPWVIDSEFKPVPEALETATGYSFPSGHTQSATSVFGAVAVHKKYLPMSLGCLFLVAMVMISRMYLGCHTPQDVITSFLITLAIAIMVDWCASHVTLTQKQELLLVCIAELLCIGLLLYYWNLVSSGTTTKELAMDGFKNVGAAMGFALAWFVEQNYVKFTTDAPSMKWQVIKAVAGLVIALSLKSGLKVILGDTLLGGTFRYFVLVFFACAVYPWIVEKVKKRIW